MRSIMRGGRDMIQVADEREHLLSPATFSSSDTSVSNSSSSNSSSSSSSSSNSSNSSKNSIPAAEAAPWRVLLAVCSVGFFVNCQPSEPYLTVYLEDDKNISNVDLERYVWPADTWSTLVALPLVGLLAEVMGYRTIIGVGLAAREATRLLLIFGNGIGPMVLMQVTYAVATSVNTVYFAYVYTVFPPSGYQRATAWVLSAYHLGNVLGSGLGQLLHGPAKWPIVDLFYLSLGFTTLGAICFLTLLPKPRLTPPPSLAHTIRVDGTAATIHQLLQLYSNDFVWRWTLWWIFGYSASQIIINYAALQFSARDHNGPLGLVEMGMELAAAVGAFLPGLLSGSVAARFTPPLLVCGSVFCSSCWALAAALPGAAASYTFNILASFFVALLVASGSAIMAAKMPAQRYAVIFTANAFLAYMVASIVLGAGAGSGMDTTGYYFLCAAMQAAFILVYMLSTRCLCKSSLRRHPNMIVEEGGEEYGGN